MKALFIGLGSAGRRHLRLWRELVPQGEALAWRSGYGEVLNIPCLRQFSTLEAALGEGPDFAVVANPTALHLDTALALARSGVPFLLEKPVSDREEGLGELVSEVAGRGLSVLVGFQLRHHPAWGQLTSWLAAELVGRPVSVLAEVGQWLPDWRPQRDYRQSYSARRVLGGGAIFDLTHEIDLALAVMGAAAEVSCLCGRFSGLDMDAEDLAEISLRHGERGLSHLHLDCLQRRYSRRFKLIGTEGTVVWDYGQGWVELLRPGEEPRRVNDPPGFSREEMFRRQMAHWLGVLAGEEAPVVSLEAGVVVSRVALAAHRSAAEGRVVKP